MALTSRSLSRFVRKYSLGSEYSLGSVIVHLHVERESSLLYFLANSSVEGHNNKNFLGAERRMLLQQQKPASHPAITSIPNEEAAAPTPPMFVHQVN